MCGGGVCGWWGGGVGGRLRVHVLHAWVRCSAGRQAHAVQVLPTWVQGIKPAASWPFTRAAVQLCASHLPPIPVLTHRIITACRGLTEGARHAAKEQQARALQQGSEAEATKARAAQCRAHNAAERRRQQQQKLAAYDAKVQSIGREAAASAAAEARHKASLVGTVKSFESTQRSRYAAQAYVPSMGASSTMQERLAALGAGTAEL